MNLGKDFVLAFCVSSPRFT